MPAASAAAATRLPACGGGRGLHRTCVWGAPPLSPPQDPGPCASRSAAGGKQPAPSVAFKIRI